MRKTIKKILSKATVAVLTLATILSPMAPAMEVNAAVPTTEATLSDFTYNVEENVMKVTAYNGDETDIVISGSKLLQEYGELPESSSAPANKVRVIGSTFTMNNLKLTDLEVDVEGAPTSGNTVQELTFGSNCKLVDASGMTVPISKSGLFSSWTELTSIDFGELIKANANSLEYSLTETFKGLESLETVTIDLTSNDTRLKFNSTFANCPALAEVTITDANISDILHMTGYDSEGTYPTDASFTFSNCTFTDSSLDAYSSAFLYFNGDIVLDNCVGSSDNNNVFSLQKFVKGPSTVSGNLRIDLGTSKVQAVDNLIASGKWNTISVNKPSTPATTKLSVIFGDTVTATSCSVTNIDTTALTELDAPFYGLDLGSADAEKTFIDNTLANVNFSGIMTVNTIGHTSHNNYTDLSNIDLSQQATAVYYETSSDVLLNQYVVPNNFTTAKSFGGTYYLPFTAWKTNDDDTMTKITEAAVEDVPLANKESVNIDGHKYTAGMLANATEYTPAQATVIFTDVETDTTRTTYCVDGTVITSVVGYDEDIDYFTDENLTQALNLTTTTVAGETLNLYYSSASNAGSLPESPSMVDKELTINFANCVVNDIPDSITVNWTATVNETVNETGSANIHLSPNLTQTVQVTVPTKVDDLNVVSHDFTIANITGFTITEASNGTTFTITKNTVTPPTEEEPDYSVIYDIPKKCSFDIPSDLTKVTATFEDGTTGPLAKDGSVVKFILDEVSTPDAYGQTSEFANFDLKQFFTIGIEVTNGDTTKVVKSLDTKLTGIYYHQYSDIDSELSAVFYYGDSTNKTPTRLISSWYDLGGSDYIQFQFDKTGYFVELFSGASYNNMEKTAKYTINWDDTGNEDKRPTTVTLEWTATNDFTGTTKNEDDYVSGVHSVTVDKSIAVQSGTFKYPRVINDRKSWSTYIESLEVADIPNYTATVVQGTSACTITLTYVPTPLEPIVENTPEGVSINFGRDIEDITATLADGSTKPLGSDNTSLIVNVKPKNLTVYQSPTNQTFDNIMFYDVTLVITDGTNEWNVKSIDSPMGIAIPIPSDCDSTSGVKVWHYDNGIMTAPTEVENKSVTSNHIVIPTSSYSYYAVSYSLGTTENKTITINWDDEGHETERPTSVVADWTATYADDSTETGNTVFNRDLAVDTQTSTVAVPRTKNGKVLVSTVANIRAVTGYEVVTTAGDPLTFAMRYVGNSPSVVTVTFGTELLNTPTGVTLPTSVPLTVYTWYVDGTKDTYETNVPIGTDGTGTLVVERPMTNDAGSTYRRTTWDWGAVNNYTLTNETAYSVYRYTGAGTGTGVQTVYPVVVTFVNDSANKTSRPSNITVTWTATTASGTATTGTATIPITTTTDSFSQNVTIPDTTGEQRTVTFTGPVINGYSMNVNGNTITYTSNAAANTNATYEIIFDDDNNKSGRRPSELTVTLADTTNSANTITSKLTIPENTTTTVKSYKSTIAIPTGTTYAITKVESLPDGYKSSISGLSATLKYTPEKVNKTYKIEWKNDVEDVRPSSVTVKVKTGDLEGASLTLNKDTNWAATTELLKFVKGVEANWVAEASSVTNYNASVDGNTITMTYTGTLTEAQKEAINATGKDGSEETKEELYNFEKFDWIDYANRYPDLKKAFGYNKEALYAHYIHYGISEGRIATWTGKYENVNEDILKAYFPNDYKYRVENTTSADEMLDEIGEGSTNKNNNSGSSSVTVDENGNTIIKTDNGDGTTTETIVDADGNVVQTKTYATGDMRMDSMIGVYIAIIIVALLLGVICLRDFIITDKNKKLIDSNIST